MKYLTPLIALMLFSNANAQKFDQKIFEVKKIYFYGYDFSHFKLTDTKARSGKEISENIPVWVGFMNEHTTQKHFCRMLDVDTVVVQSEVAMGKNKSLNGDDLIGFSKNYLPKDSIDKWVSKYTFPAKQGVGMIAFVDCFYKPEQKSIITYVFVDLSSNKVLSKETYEGGAADGYGLGIYWGESMENSLGKYTKKVFRDAKDECLKSNSKK